MVAIERTAIVWRTRTTAVTAATQQSKGYWTLMEVTTDTEVVVEEMVKDSTEGY